MKKTPVFYRIVALVIVLASLISTFTACSNKTSDPQGDGEEEKNIFDLSEYTIVRYDNSDSSITKSIST